MIDINSDEKIILKARRHWITLISGIFMLALLNIVPFALFSFVSRLNFSLAGGDQGYLILALGSMWMLFIWFIFCKFSMNYYLDVWVVTDRRIIDIEQKGFFNREVSSIRLDKIQDITISVDGIIRSIFKFGEITVQSAGEMEKFIMSDITNPYQIKDVITKLSDSAIEKYKNPGV